MNRVRPPFLYRWLSPQYILCDAPGEEKTIYLTFDDGPVPEATPRILEILGEYGVRATFFMVGDNVRKFPGIYEEVRARGHAAGNHTFHHLNGWHTPAGAYAEDVQRCREYVDSTLFRPPHGRFTPAQYFLLRREYRFVLWSVLTWDFDSRTPPGKCLENAVSGTRNGSVVVFHDSIKARDNVIYALPRYLEHFSSLGYQFSTL
ncbi:MAG TPA: polysaccharide deacetylase family protein [Bacteroidales bacterium]|nr:polysaccharide deacetylase family protein [Bacteroidales bacterium]HPS63002.1 polysaccharide deacetylase family protein [Bacteroidales bacterium]